MRTPPRSNRRTTTVHHHSGDKENLANQSPTPNTGGNKKARHRLSTTELARLEDVFRQDTHPSRQQKKDIAAELGMDYKTVTIWFQNKRQTAKRGQAAVERAVSRSGGRTAHLDSALRSVSSPSLNATLDVLESESGVNSVNTTPDSAQALDKAPECKTPESPIPAKGLNAVTSEAILKMKPLLDTLNTLTSKSGECSEGTRAKDDTPNTDLPHLFQFVSENAIGSTEHDQTDGQERIKGKPVKWKRIRTLEWACERQAKRHKLSREGFVRFGSEEHSGDDASDTRMDSALSLLSLASSGQIGPPNDVLRGALLLLSFKHS